MMELAMATLGLSSFGVVLYLVASFLKKLGAGEAAKGLIVFSGGVFVFMAALTYGPTVFVGP